MSLSALALAGIFQLARPPAVDVVSEYHRLDIMSQDIALAVELGPSPFEGPAADMAAALALVAVSAGESAFQAKVADCRIVGSDYPSVSSWQLLGPWAMDGHSKKEVCKNPTLAAYLALRVLARHAARCPQCTHRQLFYAYASGDPGKASASGRKHCDRWATLAMRFGIVASCDSRHPIRFVEPESDAVSQQVSATQESPT